MVANGRAGHHGLGERGRLGGLGVLIGSFMGEEDSLIPKHGGYRKLKRLGFQPDDREC